MKSPSPFKQYPLPASPIKAILTPKLSTTNQRQSPFPPLSTIKSLLAENDVFAISPGMFPRKTKMVDYLDILADAERAEFMSPVKSNLRLSSVRNETSTMEATTNSPKAHSSTAVLDDAPKPTVEDSNVRNENTSAEGTLQLELF